MKYNYTKSDLSKKYQLVSEAMMSITKEMYRHAPHLWDESHNRPVLECYTESGDLKKECWPMNPSEVIAKEDGPTGDVENSGNVEAQMGYAGQEGGENISEKKEKPAHIALIMQHLHSLEECMNDWHATGHPDASLALEAVHHLKDYINECSY